MRKSNFAEKQIKEVMKQRGIARKSAMKFLNREHGGTASVAVAPAPETTVELNFQPETKTFEKVPVEAPAVETPKPARARKAKASTTPATPAAKPATTGRTWPQQAEAPRREGVRLFAVAGRPTRDQFILVYGEKGPKMSWTERAAAGVPAEQFQAALAAKVNASTKVSS